MSQLYFVLQNIDNFLNYLLDLFNFLNSKLLMRPNFGNFFAVAYVIISIIIIGEAFACSFDYLSSCFH